MNKAGIHPLQADEVEELADLARLVWHTHYPGIISAAQIDFMLAQRYTAENIRASLLSSHWDGVWIANCLVGFAQSFVESSSAGWKLDKLYIHPAHQRKGIGLSLLNRVKQHALSAGATTLHLRVNKRNAAALSAYAKYGFRISGEDVLTIGNGYVMDDYLMELTLCS